MADTPTRVARSFIRAGIPLQLVLLLLVDLGSLAALRQNEAGLGWWTLFVTVNAALVTTILVLFRWSRSTP